MKSPLSALLDISKKSKSDLQKQLSFVQKGLHRS